MTTHRITNEMRLVDAEMLQQLVERAAAKCANAAPLVYRPLGFSEARLIHHDHPELL